MQASDLALMNLTMSLGRVARTYKSAADKLVGGFGLSQATAWPVVMVARLGDGVRPGMVADALGLEPSSLVRVFDYLIKAGLLERREDEHDRRAKTLHLTVEGKTCAAQVEKALIPFRRKLFSEIGAADIEACARVISLLDAAIANADKEPDERKTP